MERQNERTTSDETATTADGSGPAANPSTDGLVIAPLATAAALDPSVFSKVSAIEAIPATWEERARKAWEYYIEEPLVKNCVNSWRTFAVGDEIKITSDDEDVQSDAVSLADRLLAAADLLGRAGSAVAPLANTVTTWRPLRLLLQALTGLDAERPLPRFTGQRFDHWFAGRKPLANAAPRGQVLLWDDTWLRYYEPHVGISAVRVLEAAGFQVELLPDRMCCGRPAASRGLLAEVKRLGRYK